MSDYIVDGNGNRLTRKQVDSAIRAIKVIYTWADFQIERNAENPYDVLRQIRQLSNRTLGDLTRAGKST